MASALSRLLGFSPLRQRAAESYNLLVQQARNPVFYRNWQVPDTLDGRFDMIVLHLSLLLERLKPESAAAVFCRDIMEFFFADLDRSLRELGASDTGIGKRVQKMAEAFYGRLSAYEQAQNGPDLAETLARNVYRGQAVDKAVLDALAHYVEQNRVWLRGQDVRQLIEGNISFSPLTPQ